MHIYGLLELNMLCDCVTRGCDDHAPRSWNGEGEVLGAAARRGKRWTSVADDAGEVAVFRELEVDVTLFPLGARLPGVDRRVGMSHLVYIYCLLEFVRCV